MRFFVRCMNGKTIEIEAESRDTIEAVKAKIEMK
jgi:hypothetical protein